MFLTKKYLSRRTVLKGAGVTLALPFLEAMVPAATALAQTAAAPKLRAGFFYIPHGAIMDNTAHGPAMDRWTPSGSGAAFKLNTITGPLEPFKNYVSTIGNLANPNASGTHTRRPGTWLNCNQLTTTIDQIIAKKISQGTALPSLEVSSETTTQQAAGNGVNTAASVSFNGNTPLLMEYNPKNVFHKLFGENTPIERVEAARQKDSLLDMILDRTKALQNDLGPADRATLEEYLETVRKVERKTQAVADQAIPNVTIPGPPAGVQSDFDKQVDLLFELITLAFQTDLTRVVSYMMAAEGTNKTYNHIGVPESFHPLSHHADDLQRIDKLVKIQTWHMDRFVAFLKKMSEIREGDGTLLDSSIFLYGSNMSNSDKHSNYPIPTVIVAGGNGKMKLGGQHIVMPDRTPLANVHLTLLNKFGIGQAAFADSTGLISAL